MAPTSSFQSTMQSQVDAMRDDDGQAGGCQSGACQGDGPQAEANFAVKLRDIVKQEIQRDGDGSGLWEMARSVWWTLGLRFSLFGKPVEDLAADLHNLWFIYYEASKNTAATSAGQQQLAFQVLQTQARGVLARRPAASSAGDEATATTEREPAVLLTDVGSRRIWSDLPLFVPDMTAFWVQDGAHMSTVQRANFSHFLALLASTGAAQDGLGGLALIPVPRCPRNTATTGRYLAGN